MSKHQLRVVWSRSETWQLIKYLEQNEILWNYTLKVYDDKIKKEAIFAEIAECLKKSVKDVKMKMRALKAQHCGERTKLKKKWSRSGGKVNCHSKWVFFNALNFMFKDAGSIGPDFDSMENGTIENGNDDAMSSLSATLSIADADTDNKSIVAEPTTPTPAIPTPATQFNINKRKNVNDEDENLQLKYKISNEKDDSTALFGRYVGEKLKQFDEYRKAVLTNKIQNLIFDAEMSKLGKDIPGPSHNT